MFKRALLSRRSGKSLVLFWLAGGLTGGIFSVFSTFANFVIFDFIMKIFQINW